MHTHTYNIAGYGEVIVIVNGDWSGDATVKWGRREVKPCSGSFDPGKPDRTRAVYDHEVKIPGEMLQALGQRVGVDVVRDKVISALEDFDFEDARGAARGSSALVHYNDMKGTPTTCGPGKYTNDPAKVTCTTCRALLGRDDATSDDAATKPMPVEAFKKWLYAIADQGGAVSLEDDKRKYNRKRDTMIGSIDSLVRRMRPWLKEEDHG